LIDATLYQFLINSFNTEGDILLVGHDTTLDTSTRQLRGKEPLTTDEFYSFMGHIPYLATVAIEETETPTVYKLVDPPCMPISTYKKFDWKMLDF
jgi:ubiquitin-associated SH3 domain-containing protein